MSRYRPNAFLITIKPHADPARALLSLDRVHQVLKASPDSAGGVVGVQRPAEIANYRSVGSTPTWLAGILAAGAAGALGLALVASVRRRRREFALLKAIGFTPHQVAASVAWQSSASTTVGLIVGVPLGGALGRWLWALFANEISAVSDPTVPVFSTVVVVVGALFLASVASGLPGRNAA